MSSTHHKNEYILQLHSSDVIVQYSAQAKRHSGNRRFRERVEQLKEEYKRAQNFKEKAGVAKRVVDSVIMEGGRFLKKASLDERRKAGIPDKADAWVRVEHGMGMTVTKRALAKKMSAKEKGASYTPDGTTQSAQETLDASREAGRSLLMLRDASYSLPAVTSCESEESTATKDIVVTSLNPCDVLVGTGKGSNPHDSESNMQFHQLVLDKQAEYKSAAPYNDKHEIAQDIIDTITGDGGRFLRKARPEDTAKANLPRGVSAWLRVDNETVLRIAKLNLCKKLESDAKDEDEPRESESEEKIQAQDVRSEGPSLVDRNDSLSDNQADTTNTVNQSDVLFGRGAVINRHAGNVRYRDMIADRKSEYRAGRRVDKTRICMEIVDKVIAEGGRFLKKSTSAEETEKIGSPAHGASWVSMDHDAAMKKTMQALREKTTNMGVVMTGQGAVHQVHPSETGTVVSMPTYPSYASYPQMPGPVIVVQDPNKQWHLQSSCALPQTIVLPSNSFVVVQTTAEGLHINQAFGAAPTQAPAIPYGRVSGTASIPQTHGGSQSRRGTSRLVSRRGR